jgi:hypothetical protein
MTHACASNTTSVMKAAPAKRTPSVHSTAMTAAASSAMLPPEIAMTW